MVELFRVAIVDCESTHVAVHCPACRCALMTDIYYAISRANERLQMGPNSDDDELLFEFDIPSPSFPASLGFPDA
jgi:hypothetical protein